VPSSVYFGASMEDRAVLNPAQTSVDSWINLDQLGYSGRDTLMIGNLKSIKQLHYVNIHFFIRFCEIGSSF